MFYCFCVGQNWIIFTGEDYVDTCCIPFATGDTIILRVNNTFKVRKKLLIQIWTFHSELNFYYRYFSSFLPLKIRVTFTFIYVPYLIKIPVRIESVLLHHFSCGFGDATSFGIIIILTGGIFIIKTIFY